LPKPPNLLRKVAIEGQWKMLPVARYPIRRGEQRYDLTQVLLLGEPVVATAGTFYLEYRESGRRVRRSIGEDHAQVKAALATQTSVIGLRAMGVATDDAPQIRPRSVSLPQGKTVRAVVDAFVKSPPLEHRRRTWLKYANALESFLAWSPKHYVVEIERDDIKAFLSALVKQEGLDISTARDKATIVVSLLRGWGAPIVMRKGDWPKVTERQREIYRPEVLKKLFAGADEEEYVLFQTFLLSGMREQEVSYLWWTDFEANESELSVTKKPGFDPKNYHERTVPVPGLLVELLKDHRKRRRSNSPLIFPTSKHNVGRGAPGGQADGHMLRRLKQLAFREGLNCGRCVGTLNKKRVSCRTHAVCGEFGLHKFRHTYATTLLRDGVDILSVQKLLGHKDLDSTRRYLRALEPEDLLKKINLTSLATRFI
jgi:integrase/recombinase XerD